MLLSAILGWPLLTTAAQLPVLELQILPKDATAQVGGTLQLNAVGLTEDMETIDLTGEALWGYGSTCSASVSRGEGAGLVRAVSRGPCKITATWGELQAETTVLVTSPIVPEDNFIASLKRFPDPESKDYLTVSESLSTEPEIFNHVVRQTRKVTIVGKTVVFEEGHPNQLYESYNESDDIKEFDVYAETVIVRNHLRLPQTTLVVFARELRFEDGHSGSGPAAIETTPRSLTTRPEPAGAGVDGAPGLKAGNVTLRIERFHSDEDFSPRLILRGGDGQPAGLGRDGVNQDMPAVTTPLADLAGRVVHSEVIGLDCKEVSSIGDRKWPGELSIRAGYPGSAGSGGTLFSTLPVRPYAEYESGHVGIRGNDTAQGDGKPTNAVWTVWMVKGLADDCAFDCDRELWLGASIGILWCVDVVDRPQGVREVALAPETITMDSAPGEFELLSNDSSWLHPLTLGAVLRHLKDAYLAGHFEFVRETLSDYRTAETVSNPSSDDDRDDLAAMWDEVEVLSHRIESGLDYFGNPPGWTPLLSLEANLLAFENEIEFGIQVLWLSYWLQHAALGVEQAAQGMEVVKEKLREEVVSFQGQYETAYELIPALEVEAENIGIKIEELKVKLQRLESDLLRRAIENVKDRHKVPFWKSALKVLGTVLKVLPIPAAQPALGIIGTGLDHIATIDWNNPLPDIIDGIGDVSSAFKSSDFKAQAQEFLDKIRAVDPKNCKDIKGCLSSLSDVSREVSSRLKPIRDAFRKTAAPQNEVEAELAKIKAHHPQFNRLVDEISELNLRKMAFADRLVASVQSVGRTANGIIKNLLAIDGLGRSLSLTYRNALEPRALQHLKDMEQRAKERLLKYQYYVAKAFEYRLLKPYGEAFHLQSLFDRLAELATVSGSQSALTRDQYEDLKLLFVNELRRITAEVIEELNSSPPGRSAPIAFSLNAEELRQLNSEEGAVTVNLVQKGLFGASEEDLRLRSLRTKSLKVHAEGGGYSGYAILRVQYKHTGFSRLRMKGKTYLFNHYRSTAVSPLTWKTVYDGMDGTMTETEPSLADLSLLKYLLGLLRLPVTDWLELYSPPAAWADIVITKEVSTPNDVDMVIDELRLAVEYDFREKLLEQQAELEVDVPGHLMPVMLIEEADKNGRQDARGGFRRVYSPGQRVSVAAQPRYGTWSFDHWIGDGGEENTSNLRNPQLDLTMATNVRLRAVYVQDCPDADCPAPPWPEAHGFKRGDTNGDGRVDLSDLIATLGTLFMGDAGLSCEDAADANDDDRIDISDAILTLEHLYLNGRALPAPSAGECGADPTADTLAECARACEVR